jgi:hypothetical protein
MDSVPAVTIGTVDGPPETLLFRAIAALVMKDGTIVIANAGTSELRYHDAQGSWLRSVGGQGEGPGEFRTLTNIWRIRGDTLLAWDTRLRRLSFFAPGGEFVGSRTFVIAPVRLTSGMSMTNSVIFQGVFADGSIVARSNSVAARQLAAEGPSAVTEGFHRIDAPVFVLARDTTIAVSAGGALEPYNAAEHDTLGIFSGPEEFLHRAVTRTGGPEHVTASQVIFGERFLWASGPEFVAVGTGKPYVVNLYDRAGALRGTIGRSVEVERVTADHVRRFKEKEVAEAPEQSRVVLANMLEHVPAAETLPSWSGLRFDGTGNLWVEQFSLAQDGPLVHDVFADDGRWLARAELHRDLPILDLTPDFLLTRARDAMDVEEIRLYRIRRSSR